MDPGRTTPAEPACAAGDGSVDAMVETFMAKAEIPFFFFFLWFVTFFNVLLIYFSSISGECF